jgi:hypothetical protein
VCNDGLGTFNRGLVRLPTLPVVGLGLRLPWLPMGLVTPLLVMGHGATTLILSSSRADVDDARMVAALSRTEGTLCSSCSVVFERGVRCGFGGWCGWGGEGQDMGSMSRSKIADEEVCLDHEMSMQMEEHNEGRRGRTLKWGCSGWNLETWTRVCYRQSANALQFDLTRSSPSPYSPRPSRVQRPI